MKLCRTKCNSLGKILFLSKNGQIRECGKFLGSSVLKRKTRNQKVEIKKKKKPTEREENQYQRTPMH